MVGDSTNTLSLWDAMFVTALLLGLAGQLHQACRFYVKHHGCRQKNTHSLPDEQATKPYS